MDLLRFMMTLHMEIHLEVLRNSREMRLLSNGQMRSAKRRFVRLSGARREQDPIAVFDPVELEGTTVSRASVHNVSIVKELQLGIGDTIQVYKANMIIPQIAENLTRSSNLEIPHICPVCGEEARVIQENEVESLYCMNPDCVAKKIKAFTLFVSRDAMNIDGLSEATLEKFIAKGFIHDFGDIFEIAKHREEIVTMEGFGEKSYDNLIASIDKAKETTLAKVISSLGISNIGLSNARVICRHFDDDLDKIRTAEEEEISAIDGIGPVIAKSLTKYFKDPENNRKLDHLLGYLHINKEEDSGRNEFCYHRKSGAFQQPRRSQEADRILGRQGDRYRHRQDKLPDQQRYHIQFIQKQKSQGTWDSNFV